MYRCQCGTDQPERPATIKWRGGRVLKQDATQAPKARRFTARWRFVRSAPNAVDQRRRWAVEVKLHLGSNESCGADLNFHRGHKLYHTPTVSYAR